MQFLLVKFLRSICARGWRVALALAFSQLLPLLNAGDIPEFLGDGQETSDAGHTTLEWKFGPKDTPLPEGEFDLKFARSDSFKDSTDLYRGRNTQLVVSGLEDGEYFYKVRFLPKAGKPTAWSSPKQLIVQHHSQTLAWSLFAVGAVVFMLTVSVIVVGARKGDEE